MNWRDYYNSRLVSAQEAAQFVQSGDCMWFSLMLGQPSTLIPDAIADRRDELNDVEWIGNFTLRPYKFLQPEYRSVFRFVSGFYSSSLMRKMAASEWSNYLPFQGSEVGKKYAMRKGIYKRRTGMVVQVTPPDEHGYVNIGLDAFYTESLLNQSEWAVAEVNPNMPRTYGQTNLHVSMFNAFVENASPLPTVPTPSISSVETKIAENVMTLLRDRDCIQVGIGAVPAALSRLLENSGLKDLGIHSEMMPVASNKLVEKGVVTCKYKKTNPGKIILTFALGEQELYDWIANNPMCEFRPTSYANHVPVIAQEDNVVAINGSLEVDLTGQIASESLGDVMRSGTGGQLDFVTGAFWSNGGRAINLLPSTAMNDTVSRITPYTTQGTRVTVPRQYAGYVVTEYGVAQLCGRSEPERAEELIKIAHPKFREELEKAGRKRGLIKKNTF